MAKTGQTKTGAIDLDVTPDDPGVEVVLSDELVAMLDEPETPSDEDQAFEAERAALEPPVKPIAPAATPPVEPTPPKAEALKPAPQEPTKKTVPLEALKEERRKSKRWKDIAKQAVEDASRLRSNRIDFDLDSTVPSTPFPPARIVELKKQADESGDIGSVVEMVIQETDKWTKKLLKDQQTQLWQKRIADQQRAAQIRYGEETFQSTLREAGIFEAIRVDEATGQFVNPAIAREIYAADTPDTAEAAYRIALHILDERKKIEQEEEEGAAPATLATESSAVVEPIPLPSPTKSEKPKEIIEAEQRGAKEVVQKLTDNAGRPRGINAIPNAGMPTRRYTREDLDNLMDRNPRAYEALVEARPELWVYHSGGSETPY